MTRINESDENQLIMEPEANIIFLKSHFLNP